MKLKTNDGSVITNKHEIKREVEDYYSDIYSSKVLPEQQWNIDGQDDLNLNCLPEITTAEMKHAIRTLKNYKSPGLDGVLPQMIKYGGDIIIKRL